MSHIAVITILLNGLTTKSINVVDPRYFTTLLQFSGALDENERTV